MSGSPIPPLSLCVHEAGHALARMVLREVTTIWLQFRELA
jgi:hypothetical protein